MVNASTVSLDQGATHAGAALNLFPDTGHHHRRAGKPFPHSSGVENRRIRDLFHNATRSQWNPATDIDWDQLHPEQYTDEQRRAARMYWSRRAWGEYGAISESPRAANPVLSRTLPTRHGAVFCDPVPGGVAPLRGLLSHAEALGGYYDQPAAVAFQGPWHRTESARLRSTPLSRWRARLQRWCVRQKK